MDWPAYSYFLERQWISLKMIIFEKHLYSFHRRNVFCSIYSTNVFLYPIYMPVILKLIIVLPSVTYMTISPPSPCGMSESSSNIVLCFITFAETLSWRVSIVRNPSAFLPRKIYIQCCGFSSIALLSCAPDVDFQPDHTTIRVSLSAKHKCGTSTTLPRFSSSLF